MANCPVRIGDEGTVFELEIQDCGNSIDISSATSTQIIFIKPDNTEVVKTASFTTDGKNGKIQYIISSTDIDEIGTWQIKGKVTLVTPAGTWISNKDSFEVEKA